MALSITGMPVAEAQDSPDEVVIFVLDLSGSMNESFDTGRTKLEVAKAAFVEAFANVSPEARVGLRTYGDQLAPTDPANREASCTTDTRLVAPPAPLQRDDLIAQVESFSARGDTPMGLALQQAAGDIPQGATGTIVLFSDGRDECFDADLDGDPASGPSYGEDPCEIAKQITAGDSAVDRVVTVGFRADAAAETELRCIADSTGGTHTTIVTPEDARDALPELLVQLSAPREAQRLEGRAIRGTASIEGAPDLVRLDEIVADRVLYTDSIEMNSARFYRMAEYGPDGGTFTATVFGLPPEAGITLDMRIEVPSLGERFFEGEHGDPDAGLPERPTASIRCTDCKISGGPYEAFFVVSLQSEDPAAAGAYELELLTEGPGFGGPTTSCSAPQACFYPQEVLNQQAQLAEIQAELDAGVGELAPASLIAERDELRGPTIAAQEANDAAQVRATELEERIARAPVPSTSFTMPMLLIVLGVALGFAPVEKLRRSPDGGKGENDKTDKNDKTGENGEKADRRSRGEKRRGRRRSAGATDSTSNSPAGAAVAPRAEDAPHGSDAAASVGATGGATTSAGPTGHGGTPDAPASGADGSTGPQDARGPFLGDVGPTPEVSPHAGRPKLSWDAELEAAKAELAMQRFGATEASATSPETLPAAPLPAAPTAAETAETADERLAAVQASLDEEARQRQATQDAMRRQAEYERAERERAATAEAVRLEQARVEQAAAEREHAERAEVARQALHHAHDSAAAGDAAAAASATATAPAASVPAGWYEDPALVGQYRWWDGTAWTQHSSTDPNGAPPQ